MYKGRRRNPFALLGSYKPTSFRWWVVDKEDYNKSVSKNHAYVPEVRRIFGLKSTEDIKNKDVINKIINQITLEDVKTAIKRAETIRKGKVEEDGTKIGNSIIYANPDFSIHEFLKSVLKDSGDL